MKLRLQVSHVPGLIFSNLLRFHPWPLFPFWCQTLLCGSGEGYRAGCCLWQGFLHLSEQQAHPEIQIPHAVGSLLGTPFSFPFLIPHGCTKCGPHCSSRLCSCCFPCPSRPALGADPDSMTGQELTLPLHLALSFYKFFVALMSCSVL